jgi:class 3 adenylate cyclase
MPGSALAAPPIDRIGGAQARSPFERTLLPAFASWFVDRVQEEGPEIFLPMETKGAHLLEAVIEYARTHLGVSLNVPVMYTPALAYVPAEELATRRILLLDDATHSGRTLERQKQRVERYGAKDISLMACVGHALPRGDGEPGELPLGAQEYPVPIECFSRVGGDLYREYLWQMAELVVSRGLPPEVDHHVFRLQLPGRLLDAWDRLVRLLRPYGSLSFDGPLTANEDIISMTLHFPEFPGTPQYPSSGPVNDEGVKKVRFFADLANDSIHVVPMVFPALTIDAQASDSLSEEFCSEVVRGWAKGRETIGDLLVERAQTRDAETLFRAVCTLTEVDLIRGVAAAIGGMCGGDSTLAFSCDRRPFGRLYGAAVGGVVADYIDGTLVAALSSSQDRAAGLSSQRDDQEPDDDPSVAVEPAVADGTKRIARYLKWLYDRRAAEGDFDPIERVGLSLSELEMNLPPAGMDSLLLSRCIDYGLAMTTLVPYTDVRDRTDGQTEIRRRYRVSEANRSEEPYEDIETIRQEVDEETVALMSRFLARRGPEHWRDKPIPHLVVSRLAAVLRPVVFEEHQITLRTIPGLHGPELEFGVSRPETIFDLVSENFRLTGGGIVPTDEFDHRYDSDSLRLDLRGSSEAVEDSLKVLVSLPPGTLDEDLLQRWAISAGGRLGLDYVEWHLRQALKILDEPLTQIIRGDRLEPKDVQHPVERANQLIEAARDVLDLLAQDWSAPVRAAWPEPVKAERRLLESLSAPRDAELIQRLAHRICTATAELAGEVERLLPWAEEGEPGDDGIARTVVDACASLQRGLTSLRSDGESPPLPADLSAQRQAAAKRIKRAGRMLRAFSAALAWSFRGAIAQPMHHHETRRRTVLFADLSESTRRAIEAGHDVNWRWKTQGLNLIAQWGLAFGGHESKDRAGDDIFLEFPDADSALLCAAVIQQHTRALRSTGLRSMDWGFRIAIDTDELTTADGNNVISSGVDIPAKLSKKFKEDADSTERVLLTPAAAQAVSSAFNDLGFLVRMEEEVDLAPEVEFSEALVRARFKAHKANTAAILEYFVGDRQPEHLVRPT